VAVGDADQIDALRLLRFRALRVALEKWVDVDALAAARVSDAECPSHVRCCQPSSSFVVGGRPIGG
jgi:hypothetical protein